VIAGDAWEAPMQVMGVPDAVEGSWEDILNRTGQERFYLLLRTLRNNELFTQKRGHRAIGVVYHPKNERFGNYVPTVLPQRYDAFLFLSETQALHAMHLEEQDKYQVPVTYPWGL
jgi:erythromycin esterase